MNCTCHYIEAAVSVRLQKGPCPFHTGEAYYQAWAFLQSHAYCIQLDRGHTMKHADNQCVWFELFDDRNVIDSNATGEFRIQKSGVYVIFGYFMRPPYALTRLAHDAIGEAMQNAISLHAGEPATDTDGPDELWDSLKDESAPSKPNPSGSTWDRRVASALEALERKAK